MTKLDDLKIEASVPRPRRRRRWPWVPIIALLFLAGVVAYLQRANLADLLPVARQQPAPAATPAAQEPAIDARAAPAGSISAAGYLEVIPPGPEVVSGLVAGKVLDINAIPGQQVVKGETIAQLDSSSLQQQATVLGSRVELASRRLERLRAGFRHEEIDQAEAELTGLKARLDLAAADWTRGSLLFDRGVIARQELDALEAARNQAEANLNAGEARLRLLRAGTRSEDLRIAEAELNSAQAELQQIQWEISQCRIPAPRNGVILEQYVQPGDWITPGTDNPRSGAVASIFDPAQLQAWVDVNQRDSAALFAGQQAELSTDAQPDRPVSAFVERIMPQANLQKNTVQVKLVIPEPPPDFRPELSVKVVFLARQDSTAAEPPAGQEEFDHD